MELSSNLMNLFLWKAKSLLKRLTLFTVMFTQNIFMIFLAIADAYS